eukprot:CAMPEP_0170601298 /NCGR_PEP_ID=MMETSP0224-20130122/17786_1 /TAXON_ID=285029 /ORGANISM="Togula jolla, Strain CCCM 725" /LENGTH=99 /DNA_ID=CAMNT_0010926067 /DNA_START=270 /DNA_END=570 /DNA_ORIENTATION=-
MLQFKMMSMLAGATGQEEGSLTTSRSRQSFTFGRSPSVQRSVDFTQTGSTSLVCQTTLCKAAAMKAACCPVPEAISNAAAASPRHEQRIAEDTAEASQV